MSSETASRTNLSGWQIFWQSQRNQSRIAMVAKIILAIFVLTFALFPIIWTISAAFNPSGGISGQQLIPRNPTLNHFRTIINDEPFFTWMWNSIRIATISSILSVFITTFAAFSFSRFRFRGREYMLLGILLIQVFPALIAIVALFALLQQLGTYIPWLGLNSHGGLILIYLGGAMGVKVWLMKGFFDSIPRCGSRGFHVRFCHLEIERQPQ